MSVCSSSDLVLLLLVLVTSLSLFFFFFGIFLFYLCWVIMCVINALIKGEIEDHVCSRTSGWSLLSDE